MAFSRAHINPDWRPDRPYGPAQQANHSLAGLAKARAEIGSWPGYQPTPLLPVPGQAASGRVDGVWCKHEGSRFGLGSFKPTGPTYAMLEVLKAEVRRLTGQIASTEDLLDRRFADVTRDIVMSAPTSGNHGRALAWGAGLFGCQAALYMNDGVSPGRAAAIEARGGRVVRVAGAYRDAVERMCQDAQACGHLIIGEPPAPAYPDIPRWIMQGYALVFDELLEQLADPPPTHVFVPGGGGVLAGAAAAHLWERFPEDQPRLVVVEPDASCCLFASARAGQSSRVAVASSVMDGLVVEEPAPVAIDLLLQGAFAFVTIPDEQAVMAMRQAARPEAGDPPMTMGDTGCAAWAGWLATAQDEGLRHELGIDTHSRVAVVVTETATDPEVYRQLTGIDPADG